MTNKIILPQELKRLIVAMMYDIHQFCQDNDIKYSLAYGTMLGAVRHQGFIPWDDDIDICMLREDYEKFLLLYNCRSSKRYSVVSYKTDKQFRYTLAKVVDNRTVNNELGYNKYGVGIDLFPIDKIPSDIQKARILFKLHELFWNIFAIKNMKWNKNRDIFKNIVMICLKAMLTFIPYYVLHILMNKSALRYNNLSDYNIGCLFAPYGIKNMMHKDMFAKRQLFCFEHASFWGFEDFDTYLCNLYGDYMQLPPEDQQVTHHDIEVYWK